MAAASMINGLPTRHPIPYPLRVGCYKIGLPGVYAAPGGDPHADQETLRRGAHAGAATGEPGVAPASTAARACHSSVKRCRIVRDRIRLQAYRDALWNSRRMSWLGWCRSEPCSQRVLEYGGRDAMRNAEHPAGQDTRPPCERASGCGQGGLVALCGHDGDTLLRRPFQAAPHQTRFLAASPPQTTDMTPCLRHASSIPNRYQRW